MGATRTAAAAVGLTTAEGIRSAGGSSKRQICQCVLALAAGGAEEGRWTRKSAPTASSTEGSVDSADKKPKEGEAAPDSTKKEGDAEAPKDAEGAPKADVPKPSKRWDALNTGRSTIRGRPEYRGSDGVIEDGGDRGFGSRFGDRDPRGYDRRGGYDSRPPYDDGGRGGSRGGYDDRYGGRRDYDSRDRYGGRRDPYDDRDEGFSRFDRDDRGGYGGDRYGPPRGRYEDRGRFDGDRYGDRRGDPRDAQGSTAVLRIERLEAGPPAPVREPWGRPRGPQ